MAVEKTLSDVVAELKANNKATAQTNKNLDKLVKMMTPDGDDLESKLDKQRKRQATTKSGAFKAGQKTAEAITNPFRLLNPAAMLAPLLAGITAFSAGLVGLRGWEVSALKKVKTGLSTLGDIATKGANSLKLGLLRRVFGIGADGEKISGLGKKGDLTKVLSVEEAVNNRIQALRTKFLNTFGIGADLKPIQDPSDAMKVSAKGSLALRATAAMGKILNPVRSFATGVTDFIKGAGAGLFKFLEPFIGGAKTFASIFAKILKPIGVLISIFDGVKAFNAEEGGMYEKFKAGFSTAIADFFGAPLDLLKSGMAWILKNLLGVEVDKEGKVIPGQGLKGDALQAIKDFSFKDSIKGLINGVFGIGEKAFKWFSDLFSGEVTIGESLSILFKNWLGASTSMVDWIYNKAIAPITEWVASKFGIELDLPELDLMKTLSDTYARIKNGFMSSMESLTIWFMTMPKRIGLSLEEEWVYAMQKLKVGFVKFGDWVAGLPDSIFLGALQKIKDTVPNWAAKAMGLDESIKGAKLNISNREEITSAAMERIDYDTAKRLGEISTKRNELEALTMALNDARQYNSTTNNGSIALQQNTATVDILNGGSFDAIGGP